MIPKFFDTDQHLTEPPDFWTGRLPKKFEERAPKFLMNHPTLGPGWSWDGGKTVRPMGVESVGSEDPRKIANFKTYEEIDSGCYDPKARCEVMNVDGAQAALLFPNAGGRFHEFYPDEFYLACTQGYNNASIDWAAQGDAKRLFPGIIVPLIDSETAVAELERCAKKGFKHFIGNRWPSGAAMPVESDDPFWGAAQDLGLVMSVHGFGRGRAEPPHAPAAARGTERETGTTMQNLHAKGTMQMGIQAQELTAASRGAGLGCTPALAAFIFSGVLDRFPKLKVALIETSIGWLPYFAEQMDALWLQQRHVSEIKLKRLPSEYLSQIWASFDREWLGVKYRTHHLGPEKVLFATDYPHIGNFYPHTRFYVELVMQGVPEDEQEKMLWSNSARLYDVN